MGKIFGVVILYHPDSEVEKNIASYLSLVDRLIVMDNSEPSSVIEFSSFGDKIILIADGVNRGIAERLNAAAAIAVAENATWLLTMDQDSSFNAEALAQYNQCFMSFENKNNVAMFGIEHEQKLGETSCCTYIETDRLITSGSLINLEVFQKIGGFDENLFIDEVDSEYCFNANVKGFKTIKFQNILLDHSLGTVTEHRSLKSFKKTPRTLHSPIRMYYMVRNFLYVRDKYEKQLPHAFPHRQRTIINRIKNNFLYGKQKGELLKYLLIAYRHYKMGKMGRCKI